MAVIHQGTMQRLLVLLVALACSVMGVVAIVPGKAFDRFITIWLENQVSSGQELDRNEG